MSRFPAPPPAIKPTPLDVCDAKLARVKEHAAAWAALSTAERAALLRTCMVSLSGAEEGWIATACAAKGITRGTGGEGEERLAGTLPVMRNLRLFAEALDAGGAPPVASKSQRPDGQWVTRVFPTNTIDKLLYAGVSADIWIEPGKEPSQGRLYREKAAGNGGNGGVCVVLGAGNQSSIGPMDVLYKLVVDDEVCILKMNPVNEVLGPDIERALKPLVDAGFLELVYGGAEQGAHLCSHADTDSIHITGSARVHDLIIWGAGDEGEANKKANTPRLDKPITSELGCVTPILVVPGPWSEGELDYHARQVAAMVTYNAGFNCNAAKALVLPSGWDLREAFLGRIEQKLRAHPARKAFYPGAHGLFERFTTEYPEHKTLGDADEEVVPWTLLMNVGDGQGEYALNNEAWCGLIAVVDLEANDAAEYLAKAVPFCNDRCWGTLSMNVLIHPKTEKANQSAFDQAIADLRYGGIGINCWTGLNYGLVNATWGAFPGHPLDDIRSGQGVVHNGLLVDHPQKSVVRAPFVMKPTPAWFTDNKNGTQLGTVMAQFERAPSLWKVPKVALTALKG